MAKQNNSAPMVIHVATTEPAWPDLGAKVKDHPEQLIHVTAPWHMAGLEHGMASGRASVMLRLDLPDGRHVLAETSLRALITAARGLAIAFGEPWMEEIGT